MSVLYTHHPLPITTHPLRKKYMDNDLTLRDILQGIKKLTPEERGILEKELVIMRLSKEFKGISDKFKEKLGSKDGVSNV